MLTIINENVDKPHNTYKSVYKQYYHTSIISGHIRDGLTGTLFQRKHDYTGFPLFGRLDFSTNFAQIS